MRSFLDRQSGFGAMLWKETRENAVWAFVGAALLVAGNVLLYLLNGTDIRESQNEYFVHSFINGNRSYPVVMVGFCQLTAALLGLMQILPELRRDQWAFLVHRPLSSSRLFWAKVSAGLLLYVLAMAGSFFILTGLMWVWLIQSHVILPFEWYFLLDGIANIWNGVPFYFAALLCALRPTRWYGSRNLPLLSCAALLFFHLSVYEFWQTFLLTMGFLLPLASAAWGSFKVSGSYHAQPRWSRAMLGLSMLPVLLYLGFFMLVCLNESLELMFPNPKVAENEESAYHRYAIYNDSIPIRVSSNASSGLIGATRAVGGKPLSGVSPKEVHEFLSGIGVLKRSTLSFREMQRYVFMLNFAINRYNYFFLYSTTQNRILMYDMQEGQYRGDLGPTGFQDSDYSSHSSGRFGSPLIAEAVDDILWFGDGIYTFNLNERQIHRIREGHDVQDLQVHPKYRSVKKKTPNGFYTSSQPLGTYVGVITNATVEFFQRDGQVLMTLRREHDPQMYSNVTTQINDSGTRFWLLYSPTSEIPEVKRRTMPYFLVTLDRSGRVLDRRELPGLPRVQLARQFTRPWQAPGLGLATPLILVMGYIVFLLKGAITYQVPLALWSEQVLLYLPQALALIQYSAISGLVCALLSGLVARRAAFNRREAWAWGIGVFFLGPVGLLLLLALRPWPPRVTCPECGRKRAVHLEQCPSCSATWPERPRDGTEILAGVSL